MTAILTRERETYEQMWGHRAYSENSPGERYADLFATIAGGPGSVLDAGCGSGRAHWR